MTPCGYVAEMAEGPGSIVEVNGSQPLVDLDWEPAKEYPNVRLAHKVDSITAGLRGRESDLSSQGSSTGCLTDWRSAAARSAVRLHHLVIQHLNPCFCLSY